MWFGTHINDGPDLGLYIKPGGAAEFYDYFVACTVFLINYTVPNAAPVFKQTLKFFFKFVIQKCRCNRG